MTSRACETPQDQSCRQHYGSLNANLQATSLHSTVSVPELENSPGRRAPRSTYSQEQEDAIRFHRDDLGMSWIQVEEAYNGLYDEDGTLWERRTITGLQSRYYRLVPVTETKSRSNPRSHLGLLSVNPERRYWWMSRSQSTPEEGVPTTSSNGNSGYILGTGHTSDIPDAPKTQGPNPATHTCQDTFTDVVLQVLALLLCKDEPTIYSGELNLCG